MGPSLKPGIGEVGERGWEQHPVHQLLHSSTCLAQGSARLGWAHVGLTDWLGGKVLTPGEFSRKPRSHEEAVNADSGCKQETPKDRG